MRFEIQGEAREGTGRAANRQLRNAGRVPAIVYGGGEAPRSVSLDQNSLFHQMELEAFYTSILTLNIGGESHRHRAEGFMRYGGRAPCVSAGRAGIPMS